MQDNQTFKTAERLLHIIQQVAGGNQTAFAKRLGLEWPVLLNHFPRRASGKTSLSSMVVSAMADAGFSTDWLFTGEGSMWRVPAQEAALAQALPLEFDLGDLKEATKFAQRQAEQCQKNLERTQDLLDAKEDLLERTREDLLQAQQQTYDLKANLAQERTWRMQLQKKTARHAERAQR